MAKKTIRPKKSKPRLDDAEQRRLDARAALKRAVSREREIKRLVRQLTRELASADAELENFLKGYATSQGYDLVSIGPPQPVEA